MAGVGRQWRPPLPTSTSLSTGSIALSTPSTGSGQALGECTSTSSAEPCGGLGDDGASAFARGGRLASLCGLLIIWPLIVMVAILVKVKMPGGPASLKYRDEEELLASVEDPIRYNDTVIYPDKVRLNLYYFNHYSFWMDIKMIFATVLGRKMTYAGEVI